MGAKKTKVYEEITPEHVTVSWIAKKHSMSASKIRKDIHNGLLKAEINMSGDFYILYPSYLDWKARTFKAYVQS